MPSAWIGFYENTKTRTYELCVQLKDGTNFLSQDVAKFQELPNGPFALGSTGDVVMYVTHEAHPEVDNWIERKEILHEEAGAYATYIPADQIKLVSLRRIWATSCATLGKD
ncbi:hypothetical protein [Bartonella sp. DGB2]